MAIEFLQIDAFTAKPFGGNPAAVCLMAEHRDAAWMQAVAAEMNLSETAFVVRRGQDFDLRWFTPACEADLCGHATLASAHGLWETGWLATREEARFHTAGGMLTVRRLGEWIEMDFPAEPAAEAPPPSGLLESLGVQARFVGQSRMDFLVELDSAAAIRELAPNLAALKAVDVRGVIVTAVADQPPYDFVSRFFDPREGIDEDPATGSAHCCLGPYWQGRLGKADLLAYQASRRGGVIGVRVRGPRVLLTGQAVTILRGQLVGG